MNKQNDTLNDVLKQNSVLNEELKTKNELINILKEDKNYDEIEVNETEEGGNRNTNEQEHGNNDAVVIEIQDDTDDKLKCGECDFQTRVKKYMRSHMIAHHQGQYQC